MLKVLLVENNAKDTVWIQDALEHSGFSMRLARVKNHIAFLQALRQETWDLIVSDYDLEEFDGLDVLMRAREAAPAVPFIFMAETARDEVTLEAVKRGATGFFTKTRLSDLGHTVQLALEESQRRGQGLSLRPEGQTVGTAFCDLVEGVADWIWESDASGIFTYTNPQVQALLGYEPTEVSGKGPFDFMAPEHIEKARAELFPSGQVQPKPWSVEWTLVHKDGRRVVCETRAVPVHDPQGIHTGYRGISRDVTQRRSNENHVTHLKRIYAMMSEINKMPILVRDRSSLFREMCRVAIQHGGFRMAWIGLVDFHSCRVYPAAWHGHEDGYLAGLQATPTRSAEDGGLTGAGIRSGKGYVCNDIAHDDRMRPWCDEALRRGYRSAAAFPIRSGEFFIGSFQLYSQEAWIFDREAVRLLEGLVLDISFMLDALESEHLRHTAEAALKESEFKYRIVADNTYDWEFWLNATGQFNYCSPSCKRITGYSAKDFLSDNALLTRILHPKDLPHFLQHRKDEQARRSARLVFRILHPDGDERWIEHNCQPIVNSDGHFLGTRGSNRDITESRNLERQLRQAQKMEVIGRLSSGMARDFNNLLALIRGHANQLLTRPHRDPETNEALKQITLAAKKAGDLTRQLLTFSRQHPLNLEPLDLNQLLCGLESLVRESLTDRVTLTLDLAPQLPILHADATLLDQVVMNLALNAREAMPEGGTLTLRTQAVELDEAYARKNPESRSGTFVRLTVADTGCGIDPSNLNRVFEPFYTTKSQGEACGLGLSTVYGAVKQHEGWIDIVSQPGQGTAFAIYLPVSPRITASPNQPPVEPTHRQGHETILLVEDNVPLQCLLRRVLERNGYQILKATTGTEALNLWKNRTRPIDLVLTDVILPDGLSGRELAEALSNETDKPQIIFMSGYHLDMSNQPIPSASSPHFIAKPFEPNQLLRILRQHLDSAPATVPAPH